MITKERLAELRKDIDGPAWVDEAELCQGLKEALDTIETLLCENERLVGLSGKTGCCMQCEAYARENEALRRVAKAAGRVVKEDKMFFDGEMGYCLSCLHDECDKDCPVVTLKEALQALRGSTNADKTEGPR